MVIIYHDNYHDRKCRIRFLYSNFGALLKGQSFKTPVGTECRAILKISESLTTKEQSIKKI